MALSDERCEACSGSTPLLDAAPLDSVRAELHPTWEVVGGAARGGRLRRDVSVGDFAEALGLAVQVGCAAEAQGHHPDLLVAWGKLRIDVWTHAAGGITRTDAVLAAHIDAVLERFARGESAHQQAS